MTQNGIPEKRWLVVIAENVNEHPSIKNNPNFPPYEPPEGSVLTPCKLCNGKGWLGKKQQEAWAAHTDLEIICSSCVHKVVDPGVEPEIRLVEELNPARN